MDPCYELIKDKVDAKAWSTFSKKLLFGFKGFPPEWALSDEIRERLLLRLQWHFFNPDILEGLADKRARSWGFMTSFLSRGFQRKFSFLRSRLEQKDLEKWDRAFADFESLLYLGSMPEEMQLDWLASFDGRIRYGQSKRVRVIKKRGLDLESELLGVNILMDWPEIKARYRFLLKKNHPDVGGDPKKTKALIAEFNRLEALHKQTPQKP